jgi:hypothetical protein
MIAETRAAGVLAWPPWPGLAQTPVTTRTTIPAATARGVVVDIDDPASIGVGGDGVAALSPDTWTVTVPPADTAAVPLPEATRSAVTALAEHLRRLQVERHAEVRPRWRPRTGRTSLCVTGRGPPELRPHRRDTGAAQEDGQLAAHDHCSARMAA